MPTEAPGRLRPVDAVVALARLLRDPNDTQQAFRVVQALDGGHVEGLFRRFADTASGARLLRERPSLLAALTDRAALEALPEASLGRAYLAFCDREGIAPGGLVEASELERRALLRPELRFMADRLRDSHDLWHVVTGYRTDLRGEGSVLAFTAAQTGSYGVSLLAGAGYLRSYTFDDALGQPSRELIGQAFVRGRRAAWLPALEWERLLQEPLERVRARVNLLDAPTYVPLYPEDLAA